MVEILLKDETREEREARIRKGNSEGVANTIIEKSKWLPGENKPVNKIDDIVNIEKLIAENFED